MSFGGIAGLFLGFSLLSGVEIIYFFTLRAFCMVYKDKKVLVEIDRERRQKPMEEFNLGFQMKFNQKNNKIKEKTKNSKLLIFDGTPRPIPTFIPNSKRLAVQLNSIINTHNLNYNFPIFQYSSRIHPLNENSPPPPYTSSQKKRRIIVRPRPEDIPIFPYLP